MLCENSACSERGCRSHGTLNAPMAAAMLAAFISSARSDAPDTSRSPGSGSSGHAHVFVVHAPTLFLEAQPPRCQMR